MSGYLSFTNISCVLVLIYILFTFKSFYDIFNPPTCNLKKPDTCLYSVKNWQNEFTVNLKPKLVEINPFV